MHTVTVSDSEYHNGLPLEQKANDLTFEQRQKDIEKAEKAEETARKRMKHSPYKVFGQVNLSTESRMARCALIRKSPVAAQIWEFLMEQADKYNAVVCSREVLEQALNYGTATIARGIKVLKEMKFIDIKKSGTTNVYLLNRELVWKSWGTNYRYAEFGAKVIIAESEQEEKPTKTKRVNVVECRKEDSQPRGKDSQQPEEDEWEDSLPTEGEPPEE